MGRLDVSLLRHLKAEDFRVLIAIEMGMKNHELVSGELVASLANLRNGGVHKILKELCAHRLVSFERGKTYAGYRLTTAGYDFLGLKTLTKRNVVTSFGNQIGVGKESDIYIASDEDKKDLCIKFHRLGRTCFRKIKIKRDYHGKRTACSWLYLSRIAATKEFAYLKALYDRKFPVPRPVDFSRHCIVMDLVDGEPLNRVTNISDPESLYEELMNLIVRLGNCGVIHCDFNEFNIMIGRDGHAIIIDFPQMISTSHRDAEPYFTRDVDCVRAFFKKRFGYESELYPKFSDLKRKDKLDKEIACSGYKGTSDMDSELLQEFGVGLYNPVSKDSSGTDKDSSDEDNSEDDSDKEYSDKDNSDTDNSDKNNSDEDQQRAEEDRIANDTEQTHRAHIDDDKSEINEVIDKTNAITIEEWHDTEMPTLVSGEEICHVNDDDDDDDDSLGGNLSKYRKARKALADAISRTSYDTEGNINIDRVAIRRKVKTEREMKEKKMAKKRAIAKGEASITTRQRRQNRETIRESHGLWGWAE